MILDTLDQSDRYAALSPRFAKAFTFLKNMTDDVVIGRHEIDGDEVFALVQNYETTPITTRQYEVHRRYIDVHYIHRGREMVYWTPLATLTNETMAYDDKEDAALFAYDQIGAPFPIDQGQFTILYPSDAHIPCCFENSASEVRKVVVKVRVD